MKESEARDLLARDVVAPQLLPEWHQPAAGIRPASRLASRARHEMDARDDSIASRFVVSQAKISARAVRCHL